MKQNLHYFFSILLTIILLSPPAAAWADDLPDYLTFKAVQNVDAKLCLYYNGSTGTGNISGSSTQAHQKIYYSFTPDNEDSWALLPLGTASGTNAITIPNGSTVYVRGLCTTGINWAADNAKHYHFRVTAGYVEIGGDLMSLIDYRTKVTTVPCDYCFFRLFYSNEGSYTYNKTRIVSAKNLKLSATTLTNDCYQRLFQACAGLEYGPDLSTATNVPAEAFYCAFLGCTALKEVPTLPDVTSIGDRAYYQMFMNCTTLVTTPAINFANIGNKACESMFNGCTGLTSTGEINIETIGDYGCQGMFKGCNKLTSIVNINTNDITSVGNYGCRYMFQNCTTITSFGDLFSASTTIGNYGCYRMFDGCKGLRDCSSAHIKPLTIGNSAYACMFFQCCTNATNGMTKAPQIDATTVGTYAFDSCFCNCTTLVAPPSQIRPTTLPTGACRYMFYRCYKLETMPSLPDLCDVGASAMVYMFDNCTTLTTSPVINFKSIGANGCQNMFNNCTALTSIGNITIQDGIGNYGCNNMFKTCTNVTSLGTFSAKSVGNYGCQGMFYGCSKLANLPDIDVETVGDFGCAEMFRGCTELRNCESAHLKATSIGKYAYRAMFWNCSSSTTKGITDAPQIDATTMGKGACDSMFYNCSTLVSPPQAILPLSLPSPACKNMFSFCTKLTKFPVIKATTLSASSLTQFYYSYQSKVYYGDASEIEVRFTSWVSNATTKWVGSVASTGTFYCSSSLPNTRGVDNIPSNWTVMYYPIVTFSVATDRNNVETGGTWTDNTNANITGDWYDDGPFPTAKHASKVFRGWEDSEGNEITPESAAVARANPVNTITLYAKFESSVNFTFDVATNSATWDGSDDNDKVWASTELSTNVPANIPMKAGYRFKRWNTASNGTGDDLDLANIPSTSTTYYPIFAPLYTFDVNTNEGGWSDETTADKSWESGDIATGLATYTPTKSVNDFAGWNTEDDGTGDDLDLEDIPSTPTTYYAIFTPIPTYTVTIAKNVDGYGSIDETSITDVLRDTPISIDDDEMTIDETTVTATPASTTAEYTYAFSAWKNGETILTGDANTVTSNMTITAHFTRTANDYTLTWDFDGGTTATAVGDYTHGTVAYGTSIVAPANPTKNGYAFAGWDATPASTMPATNTTYTAQWTTINYTFDVATNGGTWDGEDDDDQVLTVSDIAGMATPQKTEFTFVGWNTETDGSGDYMDAAALPTTDTKYYAILAKVEYFRFIAGENGATISSGISGSPTLPELSYSTDDGVTWKTFTVNSTSEPLSAGESICFKGTNAGGLNSSCGDGSSCKAPSGSYWYFTTTDSVSVAGNIMTLVQGILPTNTIPADNCFAAIMKEMKLVSASELVLPTTTRSGCYKYMFYKSSLRIAPTLPALTVASSAYKGMFSHCDKLKTAPEIPATTVNTASMQSMFFNCSTLTQAPSELKAQRVEAGSYYSMFWGCISLQTAPIIRATDMDAPNSNDPAIGSIFRNCSTLNSISVRMKEWKRLDMWHSYATETWVYDIPGTGTFICPSALPPTVNETSCVPSGWTVNYIPELTFDVNTNGGTWEDESTTARVLEPETTWAIPTDVTAPANRTFVGWNTEADGTGDWLTIDNQPVISTTAVIRTYYAIYAMNLTFNVATAGATWDGSANENRTYTDVQFRRGEIPSPQRGDIEVCSAWVTAGGDTLKNNSVLTPGTVYSPLFAEYVCITAQTDNVAVGTYYYTETIPFDLYYSTNGMSWSKVNTTTGGRSTFITLNNGEKVYLRGTNASGINSDKYTSSKYIKFTVSNNATLSGNLMTLIHPTNPPTTIPNAYSFAKLFQHVNTSGQYCKITDASRLKMPATTLLASCYEGMFYDCNLLVNGPKLVATTLAANCYKWLFRGCSALRRVEVAFDDWSDDGSGNPAYTTEWMYGTTTDPANNAMFVGPAALSLHTRNIGHIQKGWKVANLVLQDNQPNYYYDCLRDTLSGYTLNSIVLKRNFWARSWVAFNVPFDFDILPSHPFYNNVYRFVGAEGDASQGFNIQFEGGVYHLDAGVPYLYYGTREDVIDPVFSTDDYYNDIVIKADAFNTAKAKYDGDDAEFNPSNSRFQGTVRLTTLTGGDNSIIFIYANRLYYPNSGGNTMRAFQGYFKVNGIPAGVAPRVRMMVDGQETGVEIEEFGADGQAAEAGTKKYIQDGVMVIERNGVKYDAQGHKLN